MARIEIKMIKNFVFKTEFPIRITDLNYSNHVGYDAYISLIHEARMRFLNTYNYSEADIQGRALLISDLAVTYKSQSFYGDILRFEIGVADFNKYGCDIFYCVTNTKTEKSVIHAKTGIVFFDLTKNKVAPVPEGFLNYFS